MNTASLAKDYQMRFSRSWRDGILPPEQFKACIAAIDSVPSDFPTLLAFLDSLSNYGSPKIRESFRTALSALKSVNHLPNLSYTEFREVVPKLPISIARKLAEGLYSLFRIPIRDEVFTVLQLSILHGSEVSFSLDGWNQSDIEMLPGIIEGLREREESEIIDGQAAIQEQEVQETEGSEVGILTDLSQDERFDEVRRFLQSLKVWNGKLVWPNHPEPNRVPIEERIRKYDLPLLVHHLVQMEGLSEGYAGHVKTVQLFCWNDHSEILPKDLRKMLNESNRQVKRLKPGNVTGIIHRFYPRL